MRDPSTTHGRAITSFYVARRQCVNIIITKKSDHEGDRRKTMEKEVEWR
jgi:hypothetical protein